MSLFDIVNCERCTNISYFALLDEVLAVFEKLLSLKVNAVEGPLCRVVELVDSVLVYCASAKQSPKFGCKPE